MLVFIYDRSRDSYRCQTKSIPSWTKLMIDDDELTFTKDTVDLTEHGPTEVYTGQDKYN